MVREFRIEQKLARRWLWGRTTGDVVVVLLLLVLAPGDCRADRREPKLLSGCKVEKDFQIRKFDNFKFKLAVDNTMKMKNDPPEPDSTSTTESPFDVSALGKRLMWMNAEVVDNTLKLRDMQNSSSLHNIELPFSDKKWSSITLEGTYGLRDCPQGWPYWEPDSELKVPSAGQEWTVMLLTTLQYMKNYIKFNFDGEKYLYMDEAKNLKIAESLSGFSDDSTVLKEIVLFITISNGNIEVFHDATKIYNKTYDTEHTALKKKNLEIGEDDMAKLYIIQCFNNACFDDALETTSEFSSTTTPMMTSTPSASSAAEECVCMAWIVAFAVVFAGLLVLLVYHVWVVCYQKRCNNDRDETPQPCNNVLSNPTGETFLNDIYESADVLYGPCPPSSSEVDDAKVRTVTVENSIYQSADVLYAQPMPANSQGGTYQ